MTARERVLIVSAHPLFRDGIIRLLGDEVEVVGAVASLEAARSLDPQPRPQVIVVDHEDADLKAADLAPLLWPEADDLRVIYVTLAGDKMTVHDRRQVTGASEADLLQALKGDRWLSSTSSVPAARPVDSVPGRREPSGRPNHMDRSQNRRHLLIVSVLVGIITALTVLFLENAALQQAPASTQAGTIDALLRAELWVIAFLFALIVVFMLYSIVVFRRRPGEDGDGVHFHGNTRLEIIWTVVPLVTVLIFSYFGAQGLRQVTAAASNEMEVEVFAQQYAWLFSFPEQGVENVAEMVVPVNQPLLLKITSRDVIHDFWVPEFRVKQDAVPGLIRDLRITPNKIGDYKVRCNELCGVLHHAMLADVRVVSQADFDTWVAGEIAAAAAGPQLSEIAQRGQELSVGQGCTACHNVSGEAGGVGPTWLGLLGSERELADGTTAIADEDYLRSSILDPNSQIVAGYVQGVMPQTYGVLLAVEDVDALVEYIKALGSE